MTSLLRRVLPFLVALVVVAGAGSTASALPGATSPAFAEARNAWLAGDEESALPSLAALAARGNGAAQVLLGLIDKTPHLQGPWLSRLPRQARVSLMRAPGGISGRSWMHAASAQVPVAGLWLRLWDVSAGPDLALDFAAAGEPRAAREALLAALKREAGGFGAIVEAPGYPPALRALGWRDWQDEGRADEVAAGMAELHAGDPQRAILGQGPSREALADWVATDSAARPLAVLCEAICPGEAQACAVAGYEALGGHGTLLTLGSPVEALIDGADFASSPRGQSATLRRMLLTARGLDGRIRALSRQSACLGAALEAERARY